MDIYKNFCDEQFDENGVLTGFRLKYPASYNFGYDVVDALARLAPEQRALVWCDAEGGERVFSFREISELSNRAANALAAQGIKKATACWSCSSGTTSTGTPPWPCTSSARCSFP